LLQYIQDALTAKQLRQQRVRETELEQRVRETELELQAARGELEAARAHAVVARVEAEARLRDSVARMEAHAAHERQENAQALARAGQVYYIHV
jgi:hypothetical protein